MNKKLDPCPPGLFDRIICAIKNEQELRHTRRLLFSFTSLLGASLVLLPFSTAFLITEWRSSGVFYFISSAIQNFTVFLAYWQEFTMSIIEVFPVVPIIVFATNMAVALFAIKLFFHRDGLLLKYIKHNLIVHHG